MDERTAKYLDCLIKDFETIKSAINRGATLQRLALVTYLGVLAFIFQKTDHNNPLSSADVTVVWFVSVLALQFYCREGEEIRRLGGIIRTRIAPIASSLLEVSSASIFNSETNASNEETDRFTRPYYNQFNWLVFGIVPCVVTLVYINQDVARLSKFWAFTSLAPWKAITSFFAAMKIAVLLGSE